MSICRSLIINLGIDIVTAVPGPSSPSPIFVTPAFSVQIPQQQHASPPHQGWFLGAVGHNEDSLGVGQGNGWQRATHMPSQSTQQVDPRGSDLFTLHVVSHPNESLRWPSPNPHESSHDSTPINGPYLQGYAGYTNLPQPGSFGNRGAPASRYAPYNTSTANPDDTRQAGAYEQTCYYGERPTGSSRPQGGSSGVDQDIGEDHTAARSFLQSLFPEIVPTVEQINLVLYTVRRVLSEF